MYAIERQNLEKHLQAMASGRTEITPPASSRRPPTPTTIRCPACPPGVNQRRTRKIQLEGTA
jgi:hypothetical protein